jgi:acetyl esterase
MSQAVHQEVLAETRAFNEELERQLATGPSIHTLPPEESREARRRGEWIYPEPVFLPQAREVTIAGREGQISLRVLAPESEPAGAYLHLHGGGWTLGAADLQDPALWALAQATGLCAVSVDYRLGPEHPYPAGPDDCEDAARWLLAGGAGELGVPARLAIGGESAGAHLAVVTLLRLRERSAGIDAFRAANLTFGAYDLSLTPSQRLWGERNLILSTPIIRWFSDCFLAGRGAEDRRDPDISPLYADLRGLPPALFTVGTLDPLIDDTMFMEARWRAAGNETTLQVWPEAIHAFTQFPIGVARASIESQHAFLRAAVA